MTDQAKESFSAWLDDNATELDIQRMMKVLESDPSLIKDFASIAQTRDSLQGAEPVDLTQGMWDKIDGVSPSQESKSSEDLADYDNKISKLFKQVASVAVAASVTLAVVFSARYVMVGGVEGTQHVPGVAKQTEQVPQDDSVVATQEKLREYLKEHTENAALNSGRAVMPVTTDSSVEIGDSKE